MMYRALAVALLLVTPALVGCLGIGGEEASPDAGLEGTKSKAEVSSSTGGIEGVVTDSAVQAVANVTVTIEELGESTTTSTDGSFAFSDITPGTYTLTFDKEAFIPAEREMDVVANEIATIEVVIAHQPSVEPYMQQFKFEGFIECSAAFPPASYEDPSPNPYSAVAACSVPNIATQIAGSGNATNDRFLFTHRVEANPWQMVLEMDWDPNQDTSDRFSIVSEVEGFPNNNSATYLESEGGPPLVLSQQRAGITATVTNMTEACEKGSDGACGHNMIEKGDRLQIRVFVADSGPEGGYAIQQDYTVYHSIFYNAPACVDYSITEENRCEQQARPPDEDPYAQSANSSNTSA